MREMKDSGIDYIGTIPSDWSLTKIKFCAYIFGRIGFRGYTEQDLVDYEEDGAITLSPSNFHDMKMDYKKCTYLSWKKYEESPEIMIDNGDVLLVKTGSTYGKAVYVTDLPKEATINPQLIVFKNIKINNKLFSYILQTKMIKIQTELAVVGGTIPTMSQEKIYNFILPEIPESEQQKILICIDKECDELDSLIFDIQSQIETLEEYKRSVITEAVTKGLDADVEMKDSGIAWVGDVPKHWILHPLYCYFGERKNKNALGLETNLLSLSYGKIIRKDINSNGGLLPESFNTYNIVEKDDIIIRPTDLQNDKRSLRTGICREHGIITSAYIAMKAIKPVSPEYFHYLLHAYDVMKVFYNMGNGVRQGLNFSEFSRLMVLEPPIEEQNAIVSYLKEKCDEIDLAISEKKQQIETIEEYKKSLIFEYVTGKKEVEI